MTNLDISIVIFALFVVLIMDIFSLGMKEKWLSFMGMIFAIVSLAYFIQNYSVVSIGNSFTIPFQLFIISWVVLPIMTSLIIGLKVR